MEGRWQKVIAVSCILCVVGCSSRKAGQDDPELISVTTSEATIAWQSAKAYAGTVWYSAAGDEAAMQRIDEDAAVEMHELQISGLQPGTRYMYRLSEEGQAYEFQTQPLQQTPFSLLMVSGEVGESLRRWMLTEFPELILDIGPVTVPSADDGFSDVRSYLPVYDLVGLHSPYRRALLGGDPKGPVNWQLGWGSLRLVILNSLDMSELARVSGAQNLGLVLASESIVRDEDTFRAELEQYNARNVSQPVAFVITHGGEESVLSTNGITYCELDAGGYRIDVSSESVSAVNLMTGDRIALREPPLQEKRTCVDCRRLAERGAYEESVKAYKEFIRTHAGHYQIDDAYFAVASILDETLFRHADAVSWYERMINDCPDSALVSMAVHRVSYLRKHSCDGFKPLKLFEQMKRDYSQARGQDAERAENVLMHGAEYLETYPSNVLTPVVCSWLANQWRDVDVERSVSFYRTLVDSFPEHRLASDARIDIGDTYYDARDYGMALAAYRAALSVLPDETDTIMPHIRRAKRNIRRKHIAYVVWTVVALIMLLSVVVPPVTVQFGIVVRSVLIGVLLFAVFFLIGLLYREQFNSLKELVILCCGLAGASSLNVLFSGLLVGKFRAKCGICECMMRIAVSLCFLLAGFYLSIYHVSEHMLTVVRL